MIIKSEAEMLELGQHLAKNLSLPAVIELIGDVGTGKTTFTRGLAAGLGITEPVTSPSFTISKRYAFSIRSKDASPTFGELIHYDFYRLDDPGIMSEDLAEALSSPNSVVVVEWGGDVANLLPTHKTRLEIVLCEDGSRQVEITNSNQLASENANSAQSTSPSAKPDQTGNHQSSHSASKTATSLVKSTPIEDNRSNTNDHKTTNPLADQISTGSNA